MGGLWTGDREMMSERTLPLRIHLPTATTLGPNSTHNPNISITNPHSVIGSIPDLLIPASSFDQMIAQHLPRIASHVFFSYFFSEEQFSVPESLRGFSVDSRR